MRVRGARGIVAALVTVLVWSLLAASTAGAADEPAPVEETVEPGTPAPDQEPAPEPDPVDEVEAAEAPTVALDQTAYTGYLTQPLSLTGTVADLPDGATLALEVRDGDTWQRSSAAVTVDPAAGTFTTSITPERSGDVRVVALGGDAVLAESAPAAVTAQKIPTTLWWSMPSAAKDYASISLKVRWRTTIGPAPSGPVSLRFRPNGSKTYRWFATVDVEDGYGETTVKPRLDGRFYVATPGTDTHGAAHSQWRAFDNRPPGTVITLPSGAPRPTIKLPAQPRHTRAAADASVSSIPDGVWSSMKGRSWHSGCPVGRGSLRLVRVSYWAFDGYVRRGELVVHERAASRVKAIFTDLFDRRTPVRSIYRVDRFGWSSKLKGADDYKSMKADNTSAFNCRQIVGRTSQRSPHAWGRSVDINPWENPYRSGSGWTPNGSWQNRSRPTSITWRGSSDPVVKVFRKHGFRWLGRADLHHFED